MKYEEVIDILKRGCLHGRKGDVCMGCREAMIHYVRGQQWRASARTAKGSSSNRTAQQWAALRRRFGNSGG